MRVRVTLCKDLAHLIRVTRFELANKETGLTHAFTLTLNPNPNPKLFDLSSTTWTQSLNEEANDSAERSVICFSFATAVKRRL